jgi:hypothetical protein
MICLPQLVKRTYLNFKIAGMEIVFLAARLPVMKLQKYIFQSADDGGSNYICRIACNRTGKQDWFFIQANKGSKLVFFLTYSSFYKIDLYHQ